MVIRRILALGFIPALFIFLFCWWFSGKPLLRYLSPDKPLTNADILVVEGWLNRSDLGLVADEFRNGKYKYLIATGTPGKEVYTMGKNGCLEFNIIPPFQLEKPGDVRIVASESLPFKDTAFFMVYANGNYIGNETVSTDPTQFSFPLNGIDSVCSISVCFLNDALSDHSDINLLVSSVILEDKVFGVNDTNVFYKVLTIDDSTIYRSAPCGSTIVKNVLIEKGIDPHRIIDICSSRINLSRTASAASNTIMKLDSAFADKPDFTFNIMSVAPHSRRTFVAFKKAAPERKIGIISISENSENDQKVNRSRNLREFSGIIILELIPERRLRSK
jgi:hypothetical protein